MKGKKKEKTESPINKNSRNAGIITCLAEGELIVDDNIFTNNNSIPNPKNVINNIPANTDGFKKDLLKS
jgi:hypothetical protein